MLGVLVYTTLVGLAFGIAAVVGIAALARVLGRRLWPHSAAALLIALGAVPPTVLAVLWYAHAADHVWAIRGPGPFAHLGGGPAMLTAFVLAGIATAVEERATSSRSRHWTN